MGILLLISVPFEHSVRAVDYSVVALKVRQTPEVVRIGTKVITRSHLCKGQQSVQLKVVDSLLKLVSRGQTAIFSTYGAYRLEIISAYSEKKGLVHLR